MQIRCMSNLRQFAIADQMYLNATKVWHLPGYWGATAGVAQYQYNRVWTGIPDFRKALAMPLSTDTVRYCYVDIKWYCPAAVRGYNAGVTDTSTNALVYPMNYSTGMNVEGLDVATSAATIASNLLLDPDMLDIKTAPQADPALAANTFNGYRDSKVKRPAEKLMFVDANSVIVNELGSGVFPGWNGKVSSYNDLKDLVSGAGTLPGIGAFDNTRTTAWRHQGGANVAFFDGHGEWLRKDQIYHVNADGTISGNDALWKVMK